MKGVCPLCKNYCGLEGNSVSWTRSPGQQLFFLLNILQVLSSKGPGNFYFLAEDSLRVTGKFQLEFLILIPVYRSQFQCMGCPVVLGFRLQ